MQTLIKKIKIVRPANLIFRNTFAMSSIKSMSKVPKSQFSSLLFTPIKYYMATSSINHKTVMKSTYDRLGYYIEQLFTGCLAIYSYYIQSGNECFLIDPLFDTNQYNQLIKNRGKKLKGIFLSHYHPDFISGQYQLQKKHGCKIYLGPKPTPTENVDTLKDKERIILGQVTLQCWHTPGHKEESSCLVVHDNTGRRDTIFTGGTMFINEVGRPDLAVKTNLTAENLASMLFDSLQKLKTLNNDIKIYPAHGSGSASGKSIGKGDFTTLAAQKQNNYGLKATDKNQFIKLVLEDRPKPPPYFGYNASINKFEPFFYKEAAVKIQKELTPNQVYKLSKQKDVIVVDVRSTDALREGIIEKSICVGFDGAFVNWIGTLINPSDKLVIYGTDNQAKESIASLFRIGYINIIGHANFPMKQWKGKKLPFVIPEFVDQIVQPNTTILDVRKPEEWKKVGVVEGSIRMQLSDLFKNAQKLDKSKVYITHCGLAYRSKIAWSFLLASGFKAKAYVQSYDSIFKSGKAKKTQL